MINTAEISDKQELNKEERFFTSETGKYGRGNFATKDIKEGETIVFIRGKRVSGPELDEAVQQDFLGPDDDLQLGEGRYLIIDKPDIYFNHSCEPNAGIRGENELFAIRNITKGEEIVSDYSSVVGKHSTWQMACKCGSGNCRGIIGNVLSIPREKVETYAKIGALPDFIFGELKEEGIIAI